MLFIYTDEYKSIYNFIKNHNKNFNTFVIDLKKIYIIFTLIARISP